MGIKNARSKYGEPSRLIQMVDTAKMGIKFESAKMEQSFLAPLYFLFGISIPI
jgi:hypothetical protein